MKEQPSNKQSHELLTLMNVGKATLTDLKLLGIDTIQNLAKSDPDELYLRLQKITGQRHDPCVWDVFAAIIHEARTGIKQPWWEWTAARKKRSAELNELIDIGLKQLESGQGIDGKEAYEQLKQKIKNTKQKKE